MIKQVSLPSKKKIKQVSLLSFFVLTCKFFQHTHVQFYPALQSLLQKIIPTLQSCTTEW